MASKRSVTSSDAGALKKRKAITMEVKLNIVKRSEKGETATNIGQLLNLSRSTVATIIKDKDRILEHVKRSAPMKSTVITKQRSSLIIEMERLLVLWLEDQNQRCIPVSLMTIQEKAKNLFEALKSEKGERSESEEFVASRGWFMRFKARANLHNLKVQSEAARDEKAANDFPRVLAEIIREGGYCAEQVFNVDETGLFWKYIPNRVYTAKEEKKAPGHSVGKERLTLLLGANAAGDFKLRPLLVHHAENPRAFKGIWKDQLPVIWKANKKAWVTHSIFEDWFTNHFLGEVKTYLASKGLPFKVLLVLDNAPGHPVNLDDFHQDIKVVYLPPNTTAHLQPMYQGVIASFKAYYLQRTIAMALKANKEDSNLTLKDFWKSYDILNGVRNIVDSWDEVKQTNLNGVWKKLCPQFVNDFHGFEETVEVVTEKVVALSKQLDLEVETDDITELLATHGEELSAEDLIKLERRMLEEEEDIATRDPKRFTSNGLAEGFALIEEGLAKFEAEDSNIARYTKVARGVMDSLQCYREIWEEKRKESFQTSLEHFFKKGERPVSTIDPIPSTSAASSVLAAQLAQSCPTKTETTTRPKPATETLSSANSLIRNDSLSHPTPAKLQKKTERQFGNQFFEEKRQMAAAAQSAQVVAPQMQVPSQMQVQQHLQVSVPPPAPVQVAPRQVQVLAPPVQVTVAKPKPVEKPRPREKRIFVVADHQRCVMSNLASLWKSGKLCDAGIGNGSSTVMVHKVVLSAVCPKLLSVFSTDILSHKFLQVNFPEEVSTEALNAFAEYMYNGILDLDRDILEQLKIIAKRLDMKEFEQLCDSHLPNHMHQPASAAVASFSNVPLIQTTMQIPPMTSSLPSLGSTISTSMHSAPSITTQVIDVKQEISEAELAQVKKDTAAVFGQESEVSSLAPNKSGNAAGFVISPSIKTEPVGPEDDKYGHLGSSNQAFTSTASSSSVVPTAASTSIASVPASSTEFAIPFSEATDVKSTRLKVTHSYDPPLVSDLSPVSCIVETVCSQSSPMNEDSSKPLNRLAVSTSSTDGLTTSTGNGGVYPVGLFTAGGDNLPLLTTQTVGIKTIDLYKTDLT